LLLLHGSSYDPLSPHQNVASSRGSGRLDIVDDDRVELSNLHRQVLHTKSRIGKHKVASAAAALSDLNDSTHCVGHAVRISSGNAMELAAG